MKLVRGELRLSGGDLAGHLACRHRTVLDEACARGTRPPPPVYPDPVADLLRERGFAHEAAYVRSLALVDVVQIDDDEPASATAATRAAMQRGAAVIVQATLANERWLGRADVLRRVDGPSQLGAFHYEVVDTKLSMQTHASTILQLSLYSELVREIQGVAPTWFHVVSPGEHDFHHEAFRVAEYEAYYRHVKARLLAWQGGETYPDPVGHCDLCRWWQLCERRRREDDSVWLVAGIGGGHKRELDRVAIPTLERLASAGPLGKPERGSLDSLERVQLQARMQLQGRRENRPVHTRLPVEAGRGLSRLPSPSPGDMFFDIEGDRMGVAHGREFLFGLVWSDGRGGLTYHAIWATTDEEERRAFEEVIDTIHAHLLEWPDLHVYHYAPYEPAALKRLMGRHATREDALDHLLRAEKFVDLCGVVRQGLRASVERYSIKDLEVFYGYARRADLRQAGAAVRAVRLALGGADLGLLDAGVRTAVEDYNREDCESARGLRDWLERVRGEAIAAGEAIARPAARSGEAGEAVDERGACVRAVSDALLAGVASEAAGRDAPQQARWLLAQMLEYHRREEKVHWWEHFRLAGLSADDARDERAALGGLVHVQTVGSSRTGIPVDRYRFPAQEHELDRGNEVEGGGDKLGTIVAIDAVAGTIDIKKTRKSAALHPDVVFHHPFVSPGDKPGSLRRLGEAVARDGFRRDRWHAGAGALLQRQPPRVDLTARPGESTVDVACRVALELGGDVLPIQGPPGTGKTHTAARMILALVRAGKKVGVTATSHKVIRNVLDAVVAAAGDRPVACLQKGASEDAGGPVRMTRDNDAVAEALADGSAQVAGGTTWLWSRPGLAESVDVLFVDEAGQMSLADTLAVAPAARSLVLVGDPRQLEQPQQGSHPDGAEVSALEHLFGGSDTVPQGRGLFLGVTWRMAPAITRFTSEQFYEGRLTARAGLERQELVGATRFAGAGLWYVPVAHVGNQNASDEEVARVARLADELLAADVGWLDAQGRRAALRGQDILVVAPYNAQVDRLVAAVGARGLRVGTVDKFQGQEAPVVIYSLASSSPEDAPRGMEFLYSLNRLNVATSRARCACILVASPRLFEPECKTPRQMRLANAFCRYLELARRVEDV